MLRRVGPLEYVAEWRRHARREDGFVVLILGETIGLSLLGLALWRSRLVSRWMALALIVGAFTHPFMPNQVLAGTGLIVAAVGFAGASLALLRMSDDEFDQPPRRAAAR